MPCVNELGFSKPNMKSAYPMPAALGLEGSAAPLPVKSKASIIWPRVNCIRYAPHEIKAKCDLVIPFDPIHIVGSLEQSSVEITGVRPATDKSSKTAGSYANRKIVGDQGYRVYGAVGCGWGGRTVTTRTG